MFVTDAATTSAMPYPRQHSSTVQGTLIVVTFCRLAITRLQHRQRQAESPRHPNRRQKRLAAAERVEDRENITVSAIEAVAGVLLFLQPEDTNRGEARLRLSIIVRIVGGGELPGTQVFEPV